MKTAAFLALLVAAALGSASAAPLATTVADPSSPAVMPTAAVPSVAPRPATGHPFGALTGDQPPMRRSSGIYLPPSSPPPNVHWVFGGCLPNGTNPNLQCAIAARHFSGHVAQGDQPDGVPCEHGREGIWCGTFLDPGKGFYPGSDPSSATDEGAAWRFVGCTAVAAGKKAVPSGAKCPTGAKEFRGVRPDNTRCPDGEGQWCGY
ncbi:hypothetical protein DFJ74DRAFT_774491 [Hyaloraphidium curvatum]|nr:hypothetical protein DFJ74DRAFT_774491 [Hyaloraphidium curvatum]